MNDAAKAAAHIRNAVKRTGVNVKGCIWVTSNDFTNDINIDNQGWTEEANQAMDEAMKDLPYRPPYTFNVYC